MVLLHIAQVIALLYRDKLAAEVVAASDFTPGDILFIVLVDIDSGNRGLA